MKKDEVYVKPLEKVGDFEFDAAVADVFENMISRSVPGYRFILDLIGLVTERYGLPDTRCYDLGCSLGASTLMMRRHLPSSCHVIGVDNSAAMVERCRGNVQRDHSGATVEILQEDLAATVIHNASLVVMNFTLQFVPPADRDGVIRRIGKGLVPGGALFLAEKIAFSDETEQAFMTELHHDFKRYQGYSDLEIAQKRAALENVMVPETSERHINRLKEAGFARVHELARCLNFACYLAVRNA